jgi:DNA-damage-inducible protein D
MPSSTGSGSKKSQLAANLFRVTQTDAKIRNEEIQGQGACEKAAFVVGRKVRATVQELSGTTSEHLPLDQPVSAVKNTRKALDKFDKE